MKVHVHKRSGKFLATLQVDDAATVESFKDQFYAQRHYYPERQRFTVKDPKGPVLLDGTLKENGVEDGTMLYFKDLGVQMSWRLVFVLEYLGPILIFPLFYYPSQLWYGEDVSPCLTQRLGFALVIFHFVKREFETLLIHRFSNATMPIHRLPVNCFHYWILNGLMIAYFLFHPRYTAPFSSPIINVGLAALMMVFEILNLQTHIVLRNLRPRGSRVRGIPTKWGFDEVSCANYMWETAAWTTFCVLTNCLTGWIFLLAAFGQMTQWALKKHRAYRKEFKDYPRTRTAILPFLV